MGRMAASYLLILNLLLLAAGVVLGGLMLASAVRERAWRAAAITAAGVIGNTALWLALGRWGGAPAVGSMNVAALTGVGLFVAASLVRFFPRATSSAGSPAERYDERDHMFSRNNMWRHPELAEAYYREHPERQVIDAAIQRKPALGAPGGRWYDPVQTPLAEAAFNVLERARPLSEGVPAPERTQAAPVEITRMIGGAAVRAADVVAELRDFHRYSHAGRHAARPGGSPSSGGMPRRWSSSWSGTGSPRRPPRRSWSRSSAVRRGGPYRLGDRRVHPWDTWTPTEVICPLAQAAGLGHVGRMEHFHASRAARASGWPW